MLNAPHSPWTLRMFFFILMFFFHFDVFFDSFDLAWLPSFPSSPSKMTAPSFFDRPSVVAAGRLHRGSNPPPLNSWSKRGGKVFSLFSSSPTSLFYFPSSLPPPSSRPSPSKAMLFTRASSSRGGSSSFRKGSGSRGAKIPLVSPTCFSKGKPRSG